MELLILHRSERADYLVDALGAVLATPLADPVITEVVSVPTRGVERWLTQRLSHRLGAAAGGEDGVCANLAFPSPSALVASATATATGGDPDADAWAPERAVWPLIDIIDEYQDDPALAPLTAHLSASTPLDPDGTAGPRRRYGVARHVADLFDRYAVHRPDLILGWLAAPSAAIADPAVAWQARLWILLRERIDSPGPAERGVAAGPVIRAEPGLLALPERLSVFGLTRVPPSQLQILDALAAHRQVHLWLLHPSGALWERTRGSVTAPGPRVRRGDDPTARLPRHPLLRSWGRDAREMQMVLWAQADQAGDAWTDRHHPLAEEAPDTLLGRIQADIRADRDPGADPFSMGAGDDSLRVHDCHGRARQVEVLRDSILHLLAADPTLEPRDVIVMCPDIEIFAPLIQAAFGVAPAAGTGSGGTGSGGTGSGGTGFGGTGGFGGSGGPDLRVRLADRSLRQTNPLLAVAAHLMALAGSRMVVSEVLDLIGRPPVARRFGLDRDDLSTIEGWVVGTGVRWGLDAAFRRPWSLERVGANTWSDGLDRLLLGVTMAEDGCRTFAGTLPFDDVPSTAVDLAGRLAELISRIGRAVAALSGPQPAPMWAASLVTATESLAVAADGEEWQHDELRATLAAPRPPGPLGPPGVAGPPGSAGPPGVAGPLGPSRPPAEPVLSLDEARAALALRLQGRPTRANFRTGDLTICTLFPMRSVPHRVVALLGLDDGAFPRHPGVDGDDLILASPRIGDRDPRAEDRQLLLDALLAARDHLVITFSGRDERTNRMRPPCAPVAELLDVVDATAVVDTTGAAAVSAAAAVAGSAGVQAAVSASAGVRARDRVVVRHPLHSFDPRNFEPGALCGAGPWGFDQVARAGAVAARSPRRPGVWLADPLPPLDEQVIDLAHLVDFVRHPVKAFLRRRLQLYLRDPDGEQLDHIPLTLDGLQKWGVGDRLLEACLSGVPIDQAETAERRRGFLPPATVADRVLGDIRAGVVELVGVFDGLDLGREPSEPVHVRVELPDGRIVVGSVPNVRAGVVAECTYSNLAPKHRIAAWVRLLACTVDQPDRFEKAVCVGRGGGRDRPVQVSEMQIPAATGVPAESAGPAGGPGSRRAPGQSRGQWAIAHLARIVDLYDRGMRFPLPMACATSHEWARARYAGSPDDEAITRAEDKWAPKGDFGYPGERAEAEHVQVWGPACDLRTLLAIAPESDETGPGWGSEASRFARLAHRLWDPVFASETLRPGRVEAPA